MTSPATSSPRPLPYPAAARANRLPSSCRTPPPPPRGKPARVQRPPLPRRLHHPHGEDEAGDDGVALGKMIGQGPGAWSELRDPRARLDDPPRQAPILRRIDHVDARAE